MSEHAEVSLPVLEAIRLHPLVCFCWKQVCGRAKMRGGYYWVAPEGLPDILGWTVDGRFFAFETKRPKERASLSAKQLEIGHKLAAGNVIRGTITSPEQAIEILNAAMASRRTA